MAEGYLQALVRDAHIDSVEIKSCGTGAMPSFQVPDIVKKLMKEKNIDTTGHVATMINKLIVGVSDLILTMEEDHKKEILRRYPEVRGKLFLLKEFAGERPEGQDLDVEDPMGKPESFYITCATEIEKYVKKSFDNLVSMENFSSADTGKEKQNEHTEKIRP
jgi:protein-tyrosine-phosphatase